ncbi:hypothetical protein D3C72_1745420 [compost metagenome]
MDLLPEPRQARAEQTAGLLRGVLADQLDLPQGQGDFLERASGLAFDQLQGALQSQAAERAFQAFGRGAETAGLAIGLAQHAQGQGRAGLHQVGYFTQRAAVVGQGATDIQVVFDRHRQQLFLQPFEPVFEGAR